MTVRQITNILSNAAERCNWKNIGFEREPRSVEVHFGKNYMLDEDETVECHSFYANKWLFLEYFDGKAHEVSEEDWFKGVERYFWNICGVHLDMTATENKTAACGD